MRAETGEISTKRCGLCVRFFVVTAFGIAFGYIEAAVVVYLRAIFYPDGFRFPLTEFGTGELWRRLLMTEIGREGATLVLIGTGAWLIGRSLRQRFAWFLVIFAVWDITYYIWLKVLLGWPGSIMDWDILFLIPMVWASPVLAPVLISAAMLVFAVVILRHSEAGLPIKVTMVDWVGFSGAIVVVLASFCLAGRHIAEADFASHYLWWLFWLGYSCAIGVFFKCARQSKIG